MSELMLIEAAKAGDIEHIKALIDSGAELEQRDDYGWTALNWAAGKGYTGIIETLADAGADIANTGRDNRTAYRIALAAAHVESAALLLRLQRERGIGLETEARPYCKAYPIEELRKFPGWREHRAGLADDAVVYLHQDYSVTLSIWHRENVLFESDSPEWEAFCKRRLAFSVPTELALAAAFAANRPVDSQQVSL